MTAIRNIAQSVSHDALLNCCFNERNPMTLASSSAKSSTCAALVSALGVFLLLSGCAQTGTRGPGDGRVDGRAATDTTRPSQVMDQVEDDGDDADNAEAGSATASSAIRQPRPAEPAPVLPAMPLTDQLLYQFLLAEVAGQRGNPSLSAQAYVDLAQRTRDPRIARRATEVALFARAADIALSAARIWYDAEPTSRRALQTYSSLLVASGQLDAALPLVEKLLAQDPAGQADAFLQVNRLLNNVRDKKAALRFVSRLVERQPTVSQAQYALAQAALAAGENEQALSAVRRARALRPDWEQALLLEVQLLQPGSREAALKLLEVFLQRYPEAREARLSYARALAGEQRLAEARNEFQRLLKAYPQSNDMLLAVGLLSMQMEDFVQADASFRRLLVSGYRDSDTLYMYLGQVAEGRKDLAAALDWYEKIQRGEQFVAARVRAAQVIVKLRGLDSARSYLAGIEPQGNGQRIQLTLAESQLLRDANQFQPAFVLLERALKDAPDNTDLLYDYAMLAEKIDRLDVLESSLRKVIALRPDNAHAYNALGYSFADRNIRLDEARVLIDRALALSPSDFFIIDSKAWIEYRLGNVATAVQLLRQAYAGRPDAEIAAHYGEVLWVSGQRELALRIWDEALKKSPTHDVLNATIKRFKP
jgi:tetratricopeptide (TPR) repeat protein